MAGMMGPLSPTVMLAWELVWCALLSMVVVLFLYWLGWLTLPLDLCYVLVLFYLFF